MPKARVPSMCMYLELLPFFTLYRLSVIMWRIVDKLVHFLNRERPPDRWNSRVTDSAGRFYDWVAFLGGAGAGGGAGGGGGGRWRGRLRDRDPSPSSVACCGRR